MAISRVFFCCFHYIFVVLVFIVSCYRDSWVFMIMIFSPQYLIIVYLRNSLWDCAVG